MKNPKVELCPHCKQEVSGLPPDGISYCRECEKVVEGSTIYSDAKCKECSKLITECQNWAQENDDSYICGQCEDENSTRPSADQMNYIFGEGGW